MIADGSKSDQPLFVGYIAAKKRLVFLLKQAVLTSNHIN